MNKSPAANHYENLFILTARMSVVHALMPKGLEGVLVVGRCASCDHLMNSSFRRMENAFQSSEVGGTAAAMAAGGATTPREVPLKALQAELRKHGLETSKADRWA